MGRQSFDFVSPIDRLDTRDAFQLSVAFARQQDILETVRLIDEATVRIDELTGDLIDLSDTENDGAVADKIKGIRRAARSILCLCDEQDGVRS